MINLGIVVVDKHDGTIDIEIPMHKVTIGKNDPYNYFKAHLRELYQDFNYELNKHQYKILLPKDDSENV